MGSLKDFQERLLVKYMNGSNSVFRISPGRQKRHPRPHNTVYSSFSRTSSLDITHPSLRPDGSVVMRLSRDVAGGKKDSRLRNALHAMSGRPDMLRAVLSDAFSHAAVRHASDILGGGWSVSRTDVNWRPVDEGKVVYMGTVALKRFVG
jgi:hypothetical protein